MKKSLIAGAGVAALGMAALPFAGVFAADSNLSQTDTVVVTVDSACSLATSGSEVTPDASTYKATIENGAANTNIGGSTFTVTCNDTNGWFISAVGAGTGSSLAHMDASTVAGDDIATGTGFTADPFTGATSSWGFKVAAGTGDHAGAAIQNNYDQFSEVPLTPQTVATGSTTSAGTAQITATYGVGISKTQAAGTYTGKVTYTLGHPASSAPSGN